MQGQFIYRLASLILFFCFTTVISSNPMLPPKAIMSELKFLEGNGWILEIGFAYGTPFQKNDYDSICIRTSSGYSRILLDNIPDGIAVFLLTKDSLPSYLNIDRLGDFISIKSYRKDFDWALDDSISFGNYPGAYISGLLPIDYSLVKLNVYDHFWSKHIEFLSRDKSPTLGAPNDTSGTTGILTGFLYDSNNNLITSSDFFHEYQVFVDSNGVYRTVAHSREVTINYICLKPGYRLFIFPTDTLKYDMYPDSTIEANLHVKNYISDVNDQIQQVDFETEIINYPNPFNSSTNFYVNIPPALKYIDGEINIFNINGEKISTLRINESHSLSWNGKNFYGEGVSSGIYYYQLCLDTKVYKSGSMILLK